MSTRSAIVSLICLVLAGGVAGPLVHAVEIKPGRINLDSGSNPVELADDMSDAAVEASDRESQEGEKDREFVVAPLPTRNPALGWTLAAPAMFMYRPAGINEDDSTWITGGAGFLSENESWGAGGFHRMSFSDDTWRFSAGAFYADVRYDYYGIGDETEGPAGLVPPIPLRQKMQFYSTETLYAIAPDLYVGARVSLADTAVALDFSPGQRADLPISLAANLSRAFRLATIAPRIKYDSRDVEFYPTSGWLIDGTASFGAEAFGGSSDYQLYKLNANTYRKFGPKGVLAGRLAMEYAGGNAPFFLFPAFGSGVDLRGYTTGSYRDRSLVAGQLEYRFRLSDRWGVVGFGGVGSVSPDLLGWTDTLYSYGVGWRWVAAPKNDLSLRIDWAWGKNDSQFYVGLSEAF